MDTDGGRGRRFTEGNKENEEKAGERVQPRMNTGGGAVAKKGQSIRNPAEWETRRRQKEERGMNNQDTEEGLATDGHRWTQRGLRRNHTSFRPGNTTKVPCLTRLAFLHGQFFARKTRICGVVVQISQKVAKETKS